MSESDTAVLEGLYSKKAQHVDQFAYAELVEPVEMRVWNNNHPVDANTKIHVAPAGTTVLITMVSRLGDLGIRDRNLTPASNGYYARVPFESLKNLRWNLK